MSKAKFLSSGQQHQLRVIKESKAVDREFYYSRYKDVFALELDPAEHYVWLGAALGRDPSPHFSTRHYLEFYPDVAKDGVNPLYHYLTSGRDEGRHPLPLGEQVGGRRRTSGPVQFRIDRSATMRSEDDWLLFVAYTPDGRLTECQRDQIRTYHEAKYRVALIVNSGDFGNLADPGRTPAEIQIVRENVGFDFGAWRHALEILGGLAGVNSVSLTNDSILPVGGVKAMRAFKQRTDKAAASVLFMTDNLEVQEHSQSYFIRLDRRALDAGALRTFRETPYFADKDDLIHQVEIELAGRLRNDGHNVGTLFPMPGTERNPTIHHWEELLDRGLPFLKVQLITAGILEIDDARLSNRLDERQIGLLRAHCAARDTASPTIATDRNVPPVKAIAGVDRFNEYGAQQAWNLPAAQNPTIKLPLAGIDANPKRLPRILAVIHGFYTDVCRTLLEQLADLAIPMRVVVTTDSDAKAATIDEDLRELGLSGEVVLARNRGRDVAPFLIEGARFANEADVILHLHSKRSPHDPVYAGWAPFLFENLIGSRETVLSILKLLEQEPLGIVYSDHFAPVVGLRNWGFDFEHAQRLLAKIGVRIGADDVLEFPTSTMFWARREAIEPLFALNLKYEDFEEEAGQIDGTLAHAIERSLLYIGQSVGLGHAKVTTSDQPSEVGCPMLRLSVDDLPYVCSRPTRFLLGDSIVRSEFYSAVPEVYPVSVARSRSKRARLTALLPTMQPAKIYGGITTALHVIADIMAEMPRDQHLRVLITSDHVDAASVAEISRRLGRSFALAMPDDDVEGDVIVGVAEHQNIPISIRRNEMYVATAWWTADLGFRLLDRQQEMHGLRPKLAYIIQDYEPGFYNWSNTYSLAEATYHRSADTVAIINSEELTRYFCGRYKFSQAYCVPYRLNARLAELIKPAEPERMMLVYGRPSVSRNCFELLREGLRIWQASDPRKNGEFQIVFAGEDFDDGLLGGLSNARNAGKMTLEDYADHLSRAAVGISLMVSPHPSYPPLEMASAGVITITNAYEGKNLEERAPNVISIAALTPADLAASIDSALTKVVYGAPKRLNGVGRLDLAVPEANYAEIAGTMLDTLGN